MKGNFPKHEITAFTLIQLQYLSKKHAHTLLIQIHYTNYSVERGNLLSLTLCNNIQTDCIQNAQITLIHLNSNQY